MHIISYSRDCRDSRETLKYGSEKFRFRAMSRRIWKLCVASLLIILCFPDYGEGALIKAMINIYHIWWQIIIHDLYTNALERMGIAKKMNGAKSKHIGSNRWGQHKRWIRWKSAKTQIPLKIEIIMVRHISKLEYPGTPIRNQTL